MHKTLNNQPMATKGCASDESKNKCCVYQINLSLNKNTSKFVGDSLMKLAKENAKKKFNKNYTFMSPYLSKFFFIAYIFILITNNIFVYSTKYVNLL